MFRDMLTAPRMIVVGAVLLLALGLILGVQSEAAHRAQKTNELEVQANILATTVMAALVFGDAGAAQESVDALRANPEIEIAAVYDAAGTLAAGYALGNAELPSGASEIAELAETDNRITAVEGVNLAGEPRGTIFLRSIGEPAARAFARYVGLGILVTMAVLLLTVFGFFQLSLSRVNTELVRRASDLANANTRLHAEMAERAKAEEALRQSQKMEAIGQLSGGIAHDFNNLLMIASGNLQLARKRLAGGPSDVVRYVDQSLEGLNRATSLTQRILAFSRRQSLTPRACDLGNLVTDMMSLLRNSVDATVNVATRLDARWRIHCDANQMENAILNLAINARDAMPNGGKLTIQTSDVTLAAPSERYPDATPGEYVEISVSDTGVGMSDEVRSKAIDPFFTTKSQGRGTGLGLSMIFGFVKQSGGHLSIESKLGAGTNVGILMPRHGTDEVREPAATDSGKIQVGIESQIAQIAGAPTILIVEDEALVRMLSVETLAEEGYNVLEAGDGKEALDILKSNVEIDVLLTDVKLPHFNGYQLVERAASLRPNMKVVFVTGYASEPMTDKMREAGMLMVTKPYQIEDLVRLVKELLKPAARPRGASSGG